MHNAKRKGVAMLEEVVDTSERWGTFTSPQQAVAKAGDRKENDGNGFLRNDCFRCRSCDEVSLGHTAAPISCVSIISFFAAKRMAHRLLHVVTWQLPCIVSSCPPWAVVATCLAPALQHDGSATRCQKTASVVFVFF